MTNNFIEASKRERWAFQQLLKTTKLFNDPQYVIWISPEDGFDVYDVLIQKIVDGSVKQRFYIELKNRMLSPDILEMCKNDGYILEKKKYDSLVKAKLDPETRLIYINFTPEKTIIWDLDKTDMDWTKKKMNKATMASRNNKVSKSVTLLKEEKGKHYEYIFNEDDYQRDIKKQLLKKENKVIGKKDRDYLWDFLNGKNN